MKKILILILIFVCSCKPVQYIPIESTRVEYRDMFRKDSIILYDSVFIRETADTVWKERYKILYRDRIIHDSVFIRDTIPVLQEVVKTKEINKLKKWQKTLIWCGGVSITLIIVLSIIGLFIFFKKPPRWRR